MKIQYGYSLSDLQFGCFILLIYGFAMLLLIPRPKCACACNKRIIQGTVLAKCRCCLFGHRPVIFPERYDGINGGMTESATVLSISGARAKRTGDTSG